MPSRHRERTDDTLYAPWKWVDKDGVVNSSGSSLASMGDASMDDNVDPGFHARVRDGEVFCNPLSFSVFRQYLLESECVARTWPTGDPSNWLECVGHHTAARLSEKALYNEKTNEAPMPAELEAICKQQCLGRVDNSPYEFFEDLLEIRETIQFLRHPLSACANVAEAFKRKKRLIQRKNEDSFSKAKALADLWNQTQFALLPLIRSAMNGLEAYNERDKKVRPARRTAHARRKDESSNTTYDQANIGISKKVRYRKDSLRIREGHAAIYYEVTNPLDDWYFRLGLRMKDWPRTVWEFMPLSFMVDRLLDIKSAISGLTNLADPDVKILAASYTDRLWSYHTQTCYETIWSYGEREGSVTDADSIQYEYFDMVRTPYTPGVADTVPVFTPGYLVSDVTKIADLIALTLSRLLWK